MTRAATAALDLLSDQIEDEDLPVGKGPLSLRVTLRHFVDRPDHPVGKAPKSHKAVLLIHGGNTSSETFLVPHGGLAGFLGGKGWDVWLLDHRGSPRVLDARILRDPPLGGSEAAERQWFTVDRIAEDDVVGAITEVRRRIGPDARLAVVGHCLGGGAVAMAIARGLLDGDEVATQAFVLTTMGLFYEVPWDGWVKAEDFLIERLLREPAGCRFIDPKVRQAWPKEMDCAYRQWPTPWLPPERSSPEQRMLRRLAFMFGSPYSMDQLDPSLRGSILLRLFGSMHLGIYLHTGQLARRGYSAAFDDPDVIDRQRLAAPGRPGVSALRSPGGPAPAPAGDLRPEHFRDKRITLITGAQNRLWHRESIDLMYEWLRNIPGRSAGAPIEKQVFAAYAHQDLYWKREPNDPVYARIRCGIE
jgi:hypothetical protein